MLASRARRLKARGLLKWIVVDYLQIMDAPNPKAGAEERTSDISGGLKKIAMELDVPVIALAQLNRATEARPAGINLEGRKPLLSDLRNSGAIEQDADVVLFIFRPHYYDCDADESVCEIIAAKIRNGKPTTIPVKWTGAQYRVDDWPRPQEVLPI